MPRDTSRPPYQPWFEGDFWSLRVRGMDRLARLMYRSLLQAAWDLPNPGVIPNDEAIIMRMADCPHPNAWKKHGPEVMKMFELSGDGSHYINTRQQQELVKIAEKRTKKVENGRKGGRPRKPQHGHNRGTTGGQHAHNMGTTEGQPADNIYRTSKIKSNGKSLKTLETEKAKVLFNDALAFDQKSIQNQNHIHNQNHNKNLLATSDEAAARLLKNYSEEEQCVIAEIWPYYLERCQRDPSRYELTPQRVSKCVMRFNEARKKTGSYQGATGLMKEAIGNLAASDFHMGRDPKTEGKRYVDFVDHLFASWTVMEKRLNDKPQKIKAKAAVVSVRGPDAGAELDAQLGVETR